MAPRRSAKWVAKGAKEEGAQEEPAAVKVVAKEPEEVITSPLLLEPFSGPNYSSELLLRIRTKLGVPEPATDEEKKQELTVHPYQFEERVVTEPAPKEPSAREKKKVSKNKIAATDEAAGSAAATGSEDQVTRQVSLSEATKGDSSPMLQRQLDPIMSAYIQSMQYAAAAMPPMYNNTAGYTTIMLRNIPNRYTRQMLLDRLDQDYKDQYDFMYLPIDFNSKCNMGYAFINFRTPANCQRFMKEFNGKKTQIALPGFSSQKVCEVSYARVQGRDANMENLKDEKFMEKLSERPEWQPLFLDDSGKEIPLATVFAHQGTGGRKKAKGGADSSPVHGMAMPPAMPGFFPSPFGMMPPWMMGPAFPPMMSQDISVSSLLEASGPQTTLMLRNVPTSVTRSELIDVLNKDFKGAYDFLWLPAETRDSKDKDKEKDKGEDDKQEEKADKEGEAAAEELPGETAPAVPSGRGTTNRGFAFISLRTVRKGKQFQEKFQKAKVSEIFPKVTSDKATDVVPARIQTLEKNLNRLKADVQRNKQTTGKWPEWYPLLLGTTGELYPFPMWPGQAGYGMSTATGSIFPSVPSEAVDARNLEKKMEKEVKPAEGSADTEGASATTSADGSSASPAKEAKKGSKAPTLPVGPGFAPAPHFAMGYPGSPVHAHAMAAAMAAASAAAQVQMQIYSSQASAQQAANISAGLLAPLVQAVTPSAQLSEEDKKAVRQQIEYYFGTDNLCKDTYLRSNMDSDGWVKLELIAGFNKVKAFRAPPAEIAKALDKCELLEVDPEVKKVRLRDEGKRKEFGNVNNPLKAAPEATATAKTAA